MTYLLLVVSILSAGLSAVSADRAASLGHKLTEVAYLCGFIAAVYGIAASCLALIYAN